MSTINNIYEFFFGEMVEPHSLADDEIQWKMKDRKLILYIFEDRCSIALLCGYRMASLFDNVTVGQFEIAVAWLKHDDMREVGGDNSTKLYDLIVEDSIADIDFDPKLVIDDITEEYQKSKSHDIPRKH